MASKSKTKDLEIIYNLQWKNKQNGAEKTSIIGVYDIPATTLNWEVFKSYLLKNSGTTGEDVKISYVTDNGKEYPIQSQTDFQVALYAFRRKARNGDVIYLKLDRIGDQPSHKNLRHSNDVETQFDNEGMSMMSNCCSVSDVPPEWFVGYMNRLKKEITEELTVTVSSVVSSALSNIKPPTSQQSCHHIRKPKDCAAKRRKPHSFIGEAISDTKHLLKTLKHERKLEEKLESLEARTKKLKEKKLALFSEKSSDSDAAGRPGARRRVAEKPEGPTAVPEGPDGADEGEKCEMNAEPVKKRSAVPHMLGGEVYLHQWEVANTGSAPWTSKTSLQFTWGSKALETIDKAVSVPYLKPGEKGVVGVRLQIPAEPGQYECYWHFMHKGRRFGHWLGCQIIVDPFDLKGNSSVLDMTQKTVTDEIFQTHCPIGGAFMSPYREGQPRASPKRLFDLDQYFEPAGDRKATEDGEKNRVDKIVRNVMKRVDHLQMNDPTDTNCSSDSDNQSVASVSADSNHSKCSLADFTVIQPFVDAQNTLTVTRDEPKPSTSAEGIENCDDNNNSQNSDNGSEKDMVVITVSKDQNESDFACILIDGQKILIPKKILKDEYVSEEARSSMSSSPSTVAAAGGARDAPQQQVCRPHHAFRHPGLDSPKPELINQIEQDNELSHCSAVGSSFSDVNAPHRLFIFPQDCPGYEVVHPAQVIPDVLEHQGMIPDLRPLNSDDFDPNPAEAAAPASHPLAPQNLVDAVPPPPLNLTTHDRNNPFNTYDLPHNPQPHFRVSGDSTTRPEEPATGPEAAAILPFAFSPEMIAIRQMAPTARPEETATRPEAAAKAPFVFSPEVITIRQAAPATRPEETATRPEAAAKAPFVFSPEVITIRQAAPATRPEETATRPEKAADIPEARDVPAAEPRAPDVRILPETLVSGAVSVASSAISTARSILGGMMPRESGRWINGHWVSANPETPREVNLQALAEMGFWNRDLNATLLARYDDDLNRVVAELVQ